MIYQSVETAAESAGLIVMGALHPANCGAKSLTDGTLILLGAGPMFWSVFTQSPEASDGSQDPIDRWSTRVVGMLAASVQAKAYFPFGGPPYAPFIDWALKSQRAFLSPVGMMVHEQVGLMISYRGALHIPQEVDIPLSEATSPCASCKDQPCVTACPVAALRADASYDLNTCHTYLGTEAGRSCMSHGCAARRACPVSAGAGRIQAQSAHHMKAFHPG